LKKRRRKKNKDGTEKFGGLVGYLAGRRLALKAKLKGSLFEDGREGWFRVFLSQSERRSTIITRPSFLHKWIGLIKKLGFGNPGL
jgi:hypothetical protein